MKYTLVFLVVAFAILVAFVPFNSTAQRRIDTRDEFESQRERVNPELMPPQEGIDRSPTTLVAYSGQVVKTQVETPASDSIVVVVNRTNSVVDVDFVAVDNEGNEVARETVVVNPKLKDNFTLQSLFPELVFGDLSTIHIQSSVRPMESHVVVVNGREGIAAKGKDRMIAQAQLPVAFFSQRDPRWSGNTLGTCSKTTIGSAGCAIASITMAGARSVPNFNPATLNTYLTNNGGYASGCLISWAAPANIDGPGGFTYIGASSVSSAANLKSLIDGSKFPVVRSSRFGSHYCVIVGYNGQGTKLSDFYYLDPWDTTAIFRQVGDSWVTASSATQIYK